MERARRLRLAWALTVLALSVFTLFSLAHIRQPVAQDDLHYLVAAKSLYKTGTAQQYGSPGGFYSYSPELYLQILVLSFRLLGESEAVARLPGIGSGLLSIIMVFLLTRSFSQGTSLERLEWAALVGLLYALTPAVIQGALIIAIDNTILIPAVLFLCWSFAQHQREQRIQWAVLAALAMAISLWGRVTTPPVVAGVLSAYALVSRNRWKSKAVAIGALIAGALLFVISWYVYCLAMNRQFSGPFLYAWGAFTDKGSSLTAVQVLNNVLQTTLWIGIFPVLLLLVVVYRRGRAFVKDRRVSLEDGFLLSGLGLLLGYLFVGGALFGYPKYQAPAIPLLCVFSGIWLSREQREPVAPIFKNRDFAALLVLLACLIQIIIMGDWIYILRYQIREAVAAMSPTYPEMLSRIGVKVILFCVACGGLFAVAMRFSFKKSIGLLYIFSIGSALGIALLQSVGGYHTGYNYGGKGTIEAAEYVRERVPAESVVIAPSEVIYYLRLPNSFYQPDAFWTDSVQLERRLADQNTSGLVYSVATNTILQVQTILTNRAVQELLSRHYDQTTVGTYTIWVRKRAAIAHAPQALP